MKWKSKNYSVLFQHRNGNTHIVTIKLTIGYYVPYTCKSAIQKRNWQMDKLTQQHVPGNEDHQNKQQQRVGLVATGIQKDKIRLQWFQIMIL